mmetsp:Transcript_20649/g.29878  ORF Transcript_20649/g.29878 Transcript_20649/m.29878 type:complete len:185 (-) Transcript_20649:255-809(-)
MDRAGTDTAEVGESKHEGQMEPTGIEESGIMGEKLAPFNPSNLEVVLTALNLLKLNSDDVLYDLGCGDGRLLIRAAQTWGIKGVGIEYDLKWVTAAQSKVEAAGLESLVSIMHANILDVSFDEATAIFLYLVPDGIRKIRDRLIQKLQSGARIVTYMFSIPDINPISEESYKSTIIRLYTSQSI